MAATHEWKVQVGAAPGTTLPSSGSASNCNYMASDGYDATATDYQNYPIPVPAANTDYSYERWLRAKFTDSFNTIDNVQIWHNAGSLSDAALDLRAGITDGYATATDGESAYATDTLTGWDTEGEAKDITPNAGVGLVAPGFSDYLVMQLVVPSTVTTPGDIGSQTIKMSYDET